ncbi:MAG: hypothetical protein U0640_15335 [Phycisphaerales bacterium]
MTETMREDLQLTRMHHDVVTRLVRLLLACSLVGVAALAGCTSPQAIVLERPTAVLHDSTIRVVRLDTSADVDQRVQDTFEARLRDRLMQEQLFETREPGDKAITLEYRFVHHEQGSSSARVAAGVASLLGSPFYGVGDGALGVEVTYRSPRGENIGRLVADAPISGAFANERGAALDAAGVIAKYTRENYKAMMEERVARR